MNKVVLIGRLTKDPNVTYTDGGLTIAKFNVAVDRKIKKEEGKDTADFPSCIAFGKTADLIEKYVGKGSKIGIEGRIQTGSYTNKDNAKVYTTDIVVESIEFLDSKSSNAPKADENDFVSVPADANEKDGLPFT